MRERLEGGSERRREGATEREREEQGRSVGGMEIGGEIQGRYHEEDTDQYTAHKTTHDTALAIATLVLQIQNYCKRVYKLCIVMRCNVLFGRWMT